MIQFSISTIEVTLTFEIVQCTFIDCCKSGWTVHMFIYIYKNKTKQKQHINDITNRIECKDWFAWKTLSNRKMLCLYVTEKQIIGIDHDNNKSINQLSRNRIDVDGWCFVSVLYFHGGIICNAVYPVLYSVTKFA